MFGSKSNQVFHKIAQICNIGITHRLYYLKTKKIQEQNVTTLPWALNLGPQTFGSDAHLSELLSMCYIFNVK